MESYTLQEKLQSREMSNSMISTAFTTSIKSIKEFASDLRTGKATSAASAVFIICNSCLGSATLAIPYTFHQAGGIYASMAVMIFSGFLLAATLVIYGYVQGYSSRKLESLGDFAAEFVGPKFAQLTQVLVFCQILGTCSSYIIIIKDQIHLLIQHHVGESYWLLDSRILTIGLTVIVIFPVSLQKDLDFLKYPSYLVILGIFYVVFDVLIRYLTGSNQPVISTKPDPFYRVFNAFPVILLGYACHFNAVPVYANMEDRSLANWTKVSVIATCCCFVCYSLVGIGGYLSYGETVESDIIQSMPNKVDATIARAMMAVAVIFSYSCVYSAGRSIVFSWVSLLGKRFCAPQKAKKGSSDLSLSNDQNQKIVSFCGLPLSTDMFSNFVITVMWLLVTSAIGLLAESLDIIANFTGSFTAHFFLVVPGIILAQTSFRDGVNCNYNKNVHLQSTSWRLFKVVFGIMVTAIGGFVFSHGVTSAVLDVLADNG